MKYSRMANQLLAALAVTVPLWGLACDDKGSSSASTDAQTSTKPASSVSAAPAGSASAAPSASASASAAPAADAGTSAEEEAAHDEAVAEELLTHHRHNHAAFAGFLMFSVDTLGIAPDQQVAVDKIRKEYRAKMRPLHEANNTVLGLLADGVAAGTIDKAKVDPAVARAGTAATAVQAALPEFETQLHAALRPEQRAALVDKVDAHWEAWRDANDPSKQGAKEDHRLTHLTKELSLTSDQADKLKAALAAGKDAKKPFDAAALDAYMKAFDTAFAGETFDAKKLPALGTDSSRLVAFGTDRMASFYEVLTPILTPDQRTKVADKLRQHASAPEPKEKP